jgi:hypothetical protein
MRLLGAVAFAAGLAIAGQATAANLLTNGSFETGDFTGWSYAGVTPSGFPAAVLNYNSPTPYPTGAFGEAIPPDDTGSPSPDAVGDHAAYFVADGATETLSQSVFLNPGLYTIGFSVYVPLNGFGNPGNATFTGSVAGVNLANFTVDGSAPQNWMHFAGVANIAVAGFYDTSFIYTSAPGAAGDFVVDRAYIVAGDVTGGVPEPTTWALMILGFGGAGAALRASRRRTALA